MHVVEVLSLFTDSSDVAVHTVFLVDLSRLLINHSSVIASFFSLYLLLNQPTKEVTVKKMDALLVRRKE